MKGTPTKLWITSQALSTGIHRVGADDVCNYEYWKNSKHRHTSEASAKAYAEEMRILKIASLEKQIEKLRKLKFE